jgi:hypothetical protein
MPAINQFKPLLTPDQLTVLEDLMNPWREHPIVIHVQKTQI